MVLTPVRQLILEVVPFSFQFKAFAAVLISTKKSDLREFRYRFGHILQTRGLQ